MYAYPRKYYTYIAKCADGSFYTGQTNNWYFREKDHNGKGLFPGARYTKSRRPIHIVYTEEWTTRAFAMHREKVLKQLSHRQKEELIEGIVNY